MQQSRTRAAFYASRLTRHSSILNVIPRRPKEWRGPMPTVAELLGFIAAECLGLRVAQLPGEDDSVFAIRQKFHWVTLGTAAFVATCEKGDDTAGWLSGIRREYWRIASYENMARERSRKLADQKYKDRVRRKRHQPTLTDFLPSPTFSAIREIDARLTPAFAEEFTLFLAGEPAGKSPAERQRRSRLLKSLDGICKEILAMSQTGDTEIREGRAALEHIEARLDALPEEVARMVAWHLSNPSSDDRAQKPTHLRLVV